MKRLVCALLPALTAFGCTLVEDLDGYSGGTVDSGTTDASVPGVDSTADTFVPDTFVPDTFAADTFAPDTFVLDTFVADTAVTDTFVADTAVTDTFVADTADAGSPYRHTITIDGTNDFTAGEKLSTTTAGFDAYVTWDASALYVGYVGADLGTSATANKWVLVYLDSDPGTATGATKTEVYGTQQHVLPTGFAADAYFAIKADESFSQLKKYSGGGWSLVASPGVTFKRTVGTTFLEIRIPFSALGVTPSKLGVLTFMLNEETTGPWSWAGLWSGSFVDGNSPSSAPKTIANWLSVDLASPLAPNTASNKKP